MASSSLLRAKDGLIEISKDGCRASVPMTSDGKERYVLAKLSDGLKARVEYGKHNGFRCSDVGLQAGPAYPWGTTPGPADGTCCWAYPAAWDTLPTAIMDAPPGLAVLCDNSSGLLYLEIAMIVEDKNIPWCSNTERPFNGGEALGLRDTIKTV